MSRRRRRAAGRVTPQLWHFCHVARVAWRHAMAQVWHLRSPEITCGPRLRSKCGTPAHPMARVARRHTTRAKCGTRGGRQSKVRPPHFSTKTSGFIPHQFLNRFINFLFPVQTFFGCARSKLRRDHAWSRTQPVAGVAWRHATPPSVALTHLVWHCLAWRHTTAPSVALAAGMPCHSQTCHSWGVTATAV